MPRYTRLQPMFQDILLTVKTFHLPVTAFDDESSRTLGFVMENSRSWIIHIDDLVRSLRSRKWSRLIEPFKTSQGRDEIAITLSCGHTPGYNSRRRSLEVVCLLNGDKWCSLMPCTVDGTTGKSYCGHYLRIRRGLDQLCRRVPTCPECKTALKRMR